MVDRRTIVRVTACSLVSMSEGFDLAAVGLSGPSLSAAFDLTRSQFGLIVTVVMAGFFVGTSAGGVLGDRHGRRLLLLLSLAVVSVSSFLTTYVDSWGWLLVARFVTGVGIGGVFPNLLAIVADSVPPVARGRAVTLTNCGGSVGGLSAALMLTLGGAAVTWKTFFLVAAIAPIPIGLIAWLTLRESVGRREREAATWGMSEVLFSGGRWVTTVVLWSAHFLTASVYYLVGNWSPIFLAQRGFAPSVTGLALMVLSISAMIGALAYAVLLDSGRRRLAVLLAFGGTLLTLPAFTAPETTPLVLGSMAALGLTAFAGQLLLYALTPQQYPSLHRATGVGTAVAAGRIGAVLSPWAIGLVLDAGASQLTLMLLVLPVVVLAGACTFFIATRPPVEA